MKWNLCLKARYAIIQKATTVEKECCIIWSILILKFMMTYGRQSLNHLKPHIEKWKTVLSFYSWTSNAWVSRYWTKKNRSWHLATRSWNASSKFAWSVVFGVWPPFYCFRGRAVSNLSTRFLMRRFHSIAWIYSTIDKSPPQCDIE